ncbi:tetratricopeptide repeat protein [Arcobacter sp. FWKO B]|uniref:tetratricopeptide repeat protein n=1 Tax=Arcobacter sp. FWKO B TaxID=2593672 RepID=UPI0018A41849|nr:tetratricopeptide repeat protein [Arcobacter sp. FWKO B]QOG12184.1 hypothetical protein FWKOB_05470 [Arcobacter sp. FWKO B]
MSYDIALRSYHDKDYQKAMEFCTNFLQTEPTSAKGWFLYGKILFDLKNYEFAKSCFLTTIELDPDFFESYYMLGNILSIEENFTEAISMWKKVLKLRADISLVYSNISTAYLSLGDYNQAYENAKQALKLDLKNIDAYRCFAKIYQAKKELDKMEYNLKQILLYNKEDTTANFELSYVYFLKQDYYNAYKYYEYRKLLPQRQGEYNYLPFKEGDDLSNVKSLLIYHEQGLGDNIIFSRFLKNLNNIDFVSIGIQNSLNRLFSYNFPEKQMLSVVDSNMNFDYCIPLMSIPHCLELDTNSPTDKYLDVDTNDIQMIKEKYSIRNDKKNIGIVFRGGIHNESDKIRNIEPKTLEKLYSIDNTKFYSLQIDRFDNIEQYPVENVGVDFKDFYDTAVFISALDMVISVDTAVAHLSGALGQNTYVLVHKNMFDWRWSGKNGKCLWYDSAQAFEFDLNNIDNIVDILKEKIINFKKVENNDGL